MLEQNSKYLFSKLELITWFRLTWSNSRSWRKAIVGTYKDEEVKVLVNVTMVKKTSRSSLFESIRWLREPASEERLFGRSVCKPANSSSHCF